MRLSSASKVLFFNFLLSAFSTPSSAQLPRQIKPKVRGFPGKHHSRSQHDVAGRGVIEPMYRLNNTFLPSRYDVEVRVIIDADGSAGPQFTAPGKVRITGVNQENTSRIVLHAKELRINQSSVSVTSTVNPGQRIEISGFSEDKLRDFFIIELGSNEIKVGEELEIYIEHVANIGTRDIGLFYKTYETEDGEIKRLAATQFQSVDARRMFPCFDEPALKAIFQLTVIRRENYTSLSNTEKIESITDPNHSGWVIDKYAPTVKMPTYLLALLVSDYDFSEAFFGTKPVRTYAPKYMIEAGGGNYSANVAAACLSFYESYFNESYKLSKMDSVAVPEFSGAMENYGLNMYGTSYLMFLPDEQSEVERSMVTLIVAHELAHQWFGNLVTLKWWNEVYLNEGITTYAQYLGMQAASPELMGLEYAILDAVQYSMLYDARSETHPLSYNVSTPDEIEGMFSTVSYEKGASVIRMVDGFLTRETLQKGLQSYLKKLAYSNVEQDDLFEILHDAAVNDSRVPEGLSMSKIMHTWTDQSGFPLVKVDVLNDTHVVLSQQRFKNHNAEDLEGLWYIPVTVVTKERFPLENNVPVLWLENDGIPQAFPHNTSNWIMINNNATGFYRTLYDKPLAELIKKQLELNASLISPLSRSQLIDDYFVLAKQKYVNIQAPLNFTTYLQQETHFTVWSTFFEHFADMHDKFSSHPGYPVLQAYLIPKVDAALISVGLEEAPNHRGALAILRADLLDWSCSLRSPLCREYAMKLFIQWQANSNSSIPIKSADARATLQCAIVATGGKVAFDFIFEKYKGADDFEAREEFLNALACATDIGVLEEFLNKTLNPESGLRSSDAILALAKVTTNSVGRSIILKFVTANIDSIIEVIGSGHARPIGIVLGTLSTYFTTQSQLDEVQKFVDANRDKLTSISATIKAVLGVMRDNISWMNTTGFDVWMWLWFQ